MKKAPGQAYKRLVLAGARKVPGSSWVLRLDFCSASGWPRRDMQDAEHPVQPLKPEAAWSHPPPMTEGTSLPDPSAHSTSAFAPAHVPYADSSTLALLQQWYAYYAQQQRALHSAQSPNGSSEAGFATAAANDPAVAGCTPPFPT